MLPDKAIFGAFGPKNTKSCQNSNMVQDSDDIVLLVNLSTNVPHVTGDQLHQEVGPGSEWPPSFKLSFQNIFASDSKSGSSIGGRSKFSYLTNALLSY